MFSALRQSNLFYILNKGEKPELKVGQVVSVSNPVPKYSTSFVPAQQFNGMDTVVDVTVKVGEETMDFKQLPSNMSIANFGVNGMVVSESREAMMGEVEAMLRNSQQTIESIPFHQSVIASCDIILRELNPQFAKEKEQEEKISTLELKVAGMDGKIDNVLDMLSKVVNGNGSSNSKKQQL